MTHSAVGCHGTCPVHSDSTAQTLEVIRYCVHNTVQNSRLSFSTY